jgi:hypothetical protein
LHGSYILSLRISYRDSEATFNSASKKPMQKRRPSNARLSQYLSLFSYCVK